jgi:hypothetical protein
MWTAGAPARAEGVAATATPAAVVRTKSRLSMTIDGFESVSGFRGTH